MSKKRGGEEGGGDSWLNTYADMVTLLLTFFAVLLSLSNTDEQKFNAFIRYFSEVPSSVVEEITGNVPEGDTQTGDTPSVSGLNELYMSLKEYVENNNQTAAVDVQKSDDGNIVHIKFNSLLFFEPDEYTLLPGSIPALSFIGDGLVQNADKIRSISICGHTADLEGVPGTSSDKNAWFLSTERACAVARYFTENKGMDGSNMVALGYAGEKPLVSNATEEGREQNRRVELIIVSTDSAFDFNAADPLGTQITRENPADGVAEMIISGDTVSGTAASSGAEASAASQTASDGQSSGAPASQAASGGS